MATVEVHQNKKRDIRVQEQRVDGLWLGKDTSTNKHLVAPFGSGNGVIMKVRTVNRVPQEDEFKPDFFNKVTLPIMDTAKMSIFKEEDFIEKEIIQQFFIKQ
eukprot:1921014-Amphidinium_carterae.1